MSKEPPIRDAGKADRAARQAAALRANLLKRKDQARLREAAKASGGETVDVSMHKDDVETVNGTAA